MTMTNTIEKYESTQRINRGEIWNAILPDVGGSVQKGERPFLIFSNDTGNRYSEIVYGIPLTSKVKKYMPTHTKLEIKEGLEQDSYVLGEQLITIPMTELKSKICTLSNEKMIDIEYAHIISSQLSKNWKFTRKR